jgi:hypothetical protein
LPDGEMRSEPEAIPASAVRAPGSRPVLTGRAGGLWAWGERLIAGEAAYWRVSRRDAWVLFLLPIVLAALVATAHLVHPIYRFLTAEDSVLEWSQVASLVLIAVFGAAVAVRLSRTGRGGWAILFALVCAGAIVIAGEEISWGQRIFGWITPQDLAGINKQGETNLHNLGGTLRILNFGMMVAAGFLTLAPIALVLSGGRQRWGAWVDYLVPPLFLVTWFVLTFGYRTYRFVRASGSSGSFAELIEFTLYAGAFLFAFILWRRLRGDARASAPS